MLERIDKLNPVVNAFCFLAADEALDAARASEFRWHRGKPMGPLDGVPTSIKDLVLTKGWPTLRGSHTVDPNQAWDIDAPATARLREAGAVLIGKTTTPEFGCKGETNSPLTGITRNPWDTTKTPGGSSGGTAVAVAAGMGPLSIGSDGAGSVRIPAAFCGNFGLKPSFGRVPAYPLSPFGTVSHLGPHTMSVADGALMMNVLKQPDARDWTSLPPDSSDYTANLDGGVDGLRVLFSPTLGYATVDSEVAGAVAAAVDELSALGRAGRSRRPRLRGSSPDHDGSVVHRCLDAVEHAQPCATRGHRSRLRSRSAARQRDDQPRCAAAEPAPRRARIEDAPTHAALRPDRHAFGRGARRSTPGRPAPSRSTPHRCSDGRPFSYPFNLTQQPACTIPCGLTSGGLPIGMQLVGPMFADALVLRAARAYEQVRPIPRPPT